MKKITFNPKLSRKYLSSPKQKRSCIFDKENVTAKGRFLELENGYVEVVFNSSEENKKNK